MQFDFKKKIGGGEKPEGTVVFAAAVGLNAPEPQGVSPAVTLSQLEAAGIPPRKIERTMRMVAEWAARNPDKNSREILLPLAQEFAEYIL